MYPNNNFPYGPGQDYPGTPLNPIEPDEWAEADYPWNMYNPNYPTAQSGGGIPYILQQRDYRVSPQDCFFFTRAQNKVNFLQISNFCSIKICIHICFSYIPPRHRYVSVHAFITMKLCYV